LPLHVRKTNLVRMLARRVKQGEIGPDLFRKACEFGLEVIVSKHRDRPFRGGRLTH
jgi:ATP-dependent DNA ligase